MDPIPPDQQVRLRLFVREQLPAPARERAETVSRRARDLSDSGRVAGVRRMDWPKRIPLGGGDPAVRDVYLAVAEWAADTGIGLQPFFQTRECYGPNTGERQDWLVLPAIALVVESDGDIRAVYPHTRNGDTATVEDGLDAVERTLVAPSDQDAAA